MSARESYLTRSFVTRTRVNEDEALSDDYNVEVSRIRRV